MKASELIKELEARIKNIGDFEILIQENGFGGYSMNTISERISTTSIHIQELLNDEDDISENEINVFFPEWDGDYDTDQDLEKECLVLQSDSMIYST